MKRSIPHICVPVLLILASLGCGGGGGPTSPLVQQPAGLQGSGAEAWDNNGRISWGYWEIAIDGTSLTAEVIPVRNADIHFNVLHMLENWACKKCVTVDKVSFSPEGHMLVDVSIRHPYPVNRLDLTGRDVRGVVIFDGTTPFYAHTTRDLNGDDQTLLASRRLLNPDGYTTHFNRWTAKPGTELTNYLRGRLTHPDELYLTGNLHPFRYFYTHDYLRLFYPGYTVTQTYEFNIKKFEWVIFGYSVDASWNPSLHWPVTNPVLDFPISASCREAYQVSMSITDNQLTRQAGHCDMEIDIFDHQGIDTISTISIEAPDLFVGKQFIDPASYIITGSDWARFDVTVQNDTGAAKTADGGSDLLVVVEDIGMSVVGEDVHAYEIFTLPVEDVGKGWRPRGGWFQSLPFPGIVPKSPTVDMTVIPDPSPPWAFMDGEPMLLFNDDSQSRYLAYNRDFDEYEVIAGYPGGLGSWLKPVNRLDASGGGAVAVASLSDYPVNSDYMVRHCTNTHIPGVVYVKSWYTDSLNDPESHYEFVGDVCGGFGTAANDPLYSIYLYESGTVPANQSLHRIQSPYNDASGVLRSFVPLKDTLTGNAAPYGVSQTYFVALGVDDDPVGEAAPLVAYVYTAENRPVSLANNVREIDAWRVNFSDPSATGQLRTFPSNVLGASVNIGLENSRMVDISILPAGAVNMYMGEDKFAEHNWLVALYQFDVFRAWYIEIFDAQSENPPPNSWTDPLYTIGPVGGEAFAIDVDPKSFEIYVLHDDGPLGTGALRLTCYQYY
jgi:hypothetical protein